MKYFSRLWPSTADWVRDCALLSYGVLTFYAAQATRRNYAFSNAAEPNEHRKSSRTRPPARCARRLCLCTLNQARLSAILSALAKRQATAAVIGDISLIRSSPSWFRAQPDDEQGCGQKERFDALPPAARCVPAPETSGERRLASLKRAAHGSGSGLAGKSTQSASPGRVGSDISLYLNIVRLRLGILTERFGRQEHVRRSRVALSSDRTVRSFLSTK